jgi:hypothetical protein
MVQLLSPGSIFNPDITKNEPQLQVAFTAQMSGFKLTLAAT